MNTQNVIANPQYIDLHGEASTSTAAGGRSWTVRGNNYALEYVEAAAGDVFSYESACEHVMIVPDDGVDLQISSLGQQVRVTEAAVVVLPAGATELAVGGDMRFVSLVDNRDTHRTGSALNQESYREPDPRVSGIKVAARREPSTGPEVFALSAYPPEPGRFGTIFQSETFLVNLLDLQQGPRDATKLSPHHHDDFEQCSLALAGVWTHHLRTPWGPDKSQWRDDEHRTIGSPSVTIIPPPLVHTSEAVGEGANRLIDVFCPIRQDFIDKGWVLNSTNYDEVQW
ncbi:hypothetical protein [Williamsia soli]|uniref:hypothetical protein n=1 Tax=Williamsia soli TaxID=364929 RepID=UPI001A9F55A9|nr:hypothetical protein [Williamsia soli]